MLYIVQFGCAYETNYMAVEADNYEAAEEFAEESAIESWESYDSNEEQNDYERYSDDWWHTVYNEISYAVESYDDSNDLHFSILQEQDYGFFNI